jgi:hypothetical protein
MLHLNLESRSDKPAYIVLRFSPSRNIISATLSECPGSNATTPDRVQEYSFLEPDSQSK